MKKILRRDHGVYEIEVIKDSDWRRVYFNGTFVAIVIGEDEARKIIWQDLVKRGEDIEFLNDFDFEIEGE